MKNKSKVLLIILVVIVGLIVFKNVIIKGVVEQTVTKVTGFPLEMKTFKMGILNSSISIKDLKLKNPKEFEEPVMIDIPEIHIDYSIKPLLTGKVHLADMRFHMKEMIVVKNSEGELNLDRLKALQPEKSDEEKDKDKPKKKKQEITIDHISLKVDQVLFKDYTKEGEPSVKEFKINLDYEAEDITNINALIQVIVFKTLSSTTIANLTNFDLTGLGSMATGTLKGATDAVSNVAGAAVGETTEMLKNTTGNLKGLIKSPFGKKE